MSAPGTHWKRRLLTGTNALLVTLLAVAIVAVAVELAGRYRARVDLSADALSTLRPETEAALAGLEQTGTTVRITAFSAQRKGQQAWVKDRMMRDLLRELELASDRVQTRFVDFDQDRLTAEELGVSRYGTVVVEGADDRVDISDRDLFRRRRGEQQGVDFLGEPAVTRAITQVMSDEPRKLYLLEGHGEIRLSTSGPRGLGVLVGLLENQGWTVEELNLLRSAEGGPPLVPEDASVVAMVGPTAQLSPPEASALGEYLARGGALGVFVDPGGVLPELVEDLGVRRLPGVVYDTVAVFPHEDRPVLGYRSHPITEDLAASGTTTVVAHAAPIERARVEGAVAQPLIISSRRGWIERGSERPAVYDAATDGAGPVLVALALRVGPPHPAINLGRVSRVLVMGDSDALTDELMADGPGNTTFAVNSLRWLAGDEERMSWVGRPTDRRRLSLSTTQLRVVQWLVLGLMPLLAVLAGALMWWMRRDR